MRQQNPKISNTDLQHLFFIQRLSMGQISKRLGIPKSVVHYRLKIIKKAQGEMLPTSNLLPSMAKDMGRKEEYETNYAEKTVAKNLNALDQLQNINNQANKILSWTMSAEKLSEKIKEAMDHAAEEKNPIIYNAIIKRLTDIIITDHNTALKACAEIRGQLQLQLELFKTLYSVEGIMEFQRVVIDCITRLAPEMKEPIFEELKKIRINRFGPPNAKLKRAII